MSRVPKTPALRALRGAGVEFSEHLYRYEEHGGTAVAARALGIDEHAVVKTLVLEDDQRQPLVVLMHGDREVSLKRLARRIGRRTVAVCAPETAERHTGYRVGGTSPFGLRKPLPVFVEASVLRLARVFVNGGSRGVLVGLAPDDLARLLKPTPVEVAS